VPLSSDPELGGRSVTRSLGGGSAFTLLSSSFFNRLTARGLTKPGKAPTVEPSDLLYLCARSRVADNLANWIESDECISSCGVDRNTVGISSDSLMEPHFTAKLCSPACNLNCPNIVDLYNNLALAEGVVLADICKVQQSMPRRMMSQLMSSGYAAGPISAAQAQAPSASVASASAPAYI